MTRSIGRVIPLLALLAGMPLAARQAQPPSFGAANRTVAIYATVSSPQGRLITDLTRDDFTVDDNGKRQPLTLFSSDIQPITVVMLLDRSGSMKPNFELEERAAAAFVHEMVLPKDKARIGSFGNRIQIDPEDFTSDHDVLNKILKSELQTDGPTPLWNAVDRGIDKLLVEQGRRVVLVFTDGVDQPMNFSGKNRSLKDVMKRAEEEDVMVYAIGLAGDNAGPGGRMQSPFGSGIGGRGLGANPRGVQLERPDEGLPKIAAATGGGYFELTTPRGLSTVFTHIADELHQQYALGFTPEKLDDKMHDLAVHTSKPDLVVRARKLYLASKAR